MLGVDVRTCVLRGGEAEVVAAPLPVGDRADQRRRPARGAGEIGARRGGVALQPGVWHVLPAGNGGGKGLRGGAVHRALRGEAAAHGRAFPGLLLPRWYGLGGGGRGRHVRGETRLRYRDG